MCVLDFLYFSDLLLVLLSESFGFILMFSNQGCSLRLESLYLAGLLSVDGIKLILVALLEGRDLVVERTDGLSI